MTTRIGFLSMAGTHAPGCLEIIERMAGVEFVGVADEDDPVTPEGAIEDAPRLPTGELLDEADAVMTFSTYDRRRYWIEQAVEAGVPVLCEKPLASTVADAIAIRDACAEAGVSLGMLLPLRFSEPAMRARPIVSDVIGDLQQAVGVNRCRLRDRHMSGWTADPEHAGGGSVMSHSAHLVDLIRWLTDEEIAEVYAELGHMHDLDVEDTDQLCLTLTDGASVFVDTSWSAPEADDYWGDATLDLLGDDGSLSIDCYGQTFKSVSREGIQQTYWGTDPTEAVIAEFVQAIETGDDPEATAVDGLRQVEVIEAAYRSAREHEPVAVEHHD